MATTRLFSRSRPLFAPSAFIPSLPPLNCNTSASSASLMNELRAKKELRARKVKFSMVFNEKIWNRWREDAEELAKKEGSPFAILADHISTNKTSYNPKMEKLEEHLRAWRDINLFGIWC